MIVFEEFLRQLYVHVLGRNDIKNNVIRKHTNKLSAMGDFSFPKHVLDWKSKEEYDESDSRSFVDDIKKASSEWVLHIDSSLLSPKNDWCLFLERPHAYRTTIEQVLHESERFGSSHIVMPTIRFHQTDDVDVLSLNLTDLRIHLTQMVLKNVAKFLDCLQNEEDNVSADGRTVYLSDNSMKYSRDNIVHTENRIFILCSPVLSDNNKKKDNLMVAEELYKNRIVAMRLMAEHKYGLRMTSQPGWQKFYEKLGAAAVVIELLQNKPNKAVKLNLTDATMMNNKGASFILYNCARIARLLKEFNAKVANGSYPKLAAVDNIDFSLLTQEEEWELLYVHVMQFPWIVKSVIDDIEFAAVNPHRLVSALSALCATFSVYYRRVKILTERRDHIVPILFARIYLVMAVQQVLHNGLNLLDIKPVNQM